jgi:hypothetical protein
MSRSAMSIIDSPALCAASRATLPALWPWRTIHRRSGQPRLIDDALKNLPGLVGQRIPLEFIGRNPAKGSYRPSFSAFKIRPMALSIRRTDRNLFADQDSEPLHPCARQWQQQT